VRRAAGERITDAILQLEAYRRAARVLAYMSIGTEFETGTFIANARSAGKQLCLPRVDRPAREIVVHEVSDLDRDLVAGVWGIREPRADCAVADLATIDFVLVPGVAFTALCERLGYGAGFYDRLIGRLTHKPPLVAAAFDLQILDAIPMTGRDQLIDMVITESAVYRRQ
jgi:5-formyltetrahydrofolate cyclo-ligase